MAKTRNTTQIQDITFKERFSALKNLPNFLEINRSNSLLKVIPLKYLFLNLYG